MVYLGYTEGIKAYTFMRTTNNTLFTSTTALFDETLFPKCNTACIRGTTHVQLPPTSQPPFDASEDTTPGDFDNPLPSKKVSKVLLPDEAPAVTPTFRFATYVYHWTALPLLPDFDRYTPISRCLADTA